MKKTIVLSAMVFAIAVLAQPKAQAGVFVRSGSSLLRAGVLPGRLLLWPFRLFLLPETLLAPPNLVPRTLALQLKYCRRALR